MADFVATFPYRILPVVPTNTKAEAVAAVTEEVGEEEEAAERGRWWQRRRWRWKEEGGQRNSEVWVGLE